MAGAHKAARVAARYARASAGKAAARRIVDVADGSTRPLGLRTELT
jgi:hypothetical protein